MKLNHWARLFSVLLCGLLVVLSCGDDNPSDLTDTTPPARVTTLSVDSVTSSGALLTWIATGDDGVTGNASEYDIRYSLHPDSSANWWDSLTVAVTGSLAPKAPGQSESLWVNDLLSDTLYYFGLVVLDEAGNESALSNVDTARTAGEPDTTDTSPPARVDDLEAIAQSFHSIRVRWTAPGDDSLSGQATGYDLRIDTTAITESNWSDATQLDDEPSPGTAGSRDSMTATGLLPETIYYFALKTTDADSNWSALSNVARDTTGAAPDTLPPPPITDLAAEAVSPTSVRLTWTTPDDPSKMATRFVATRYLIRRSSQTIDDQSWDTASVIENSLVPGSPSQQETLLVGNLLSKTTYYFAIRAEDGDDNLSSTSNSPHAATWPSDVTPPTTIADLAAPVKTSSSVLLTWTAPVDSGVDGAEIITGPAESYDIRIATNSFDEGDWASLDVLSQALDPKEPGELESLYVESLLPSTEYYFGIRSSDGENISALSNVLPATTSSVPEEVVVEVDSQETEIVHDEVTVSVPAGLFVEATDITLNTNASFSHEAPPPSVTEHSEVVSLILPIGGVADIDTLGYSLWMDVTVDADPPPDAYVHMNVKIPGREDLLLYARLDTASKSDEARYKIPLHLFKQVATSSGDITVESQVVSLGDKEKAHVPMALYHATLTSPSSFNLDLVSGDAAPMGNKIPLLLVHGWSVWPSVQFESYDQETKLRNYWESAILQILNEDDAAASFGVFCLYYDEDDPLGDLATELEGFVPGKFDQSGSDEILVLAHSMGGLVTRAWEEYEDDASLLRGAVFLDTPHHGSGIANAGRMGLPIILYLTGTNNLLYDEYLPGEPLWALILGHNTYLEDLNGIDDNWDRYAMVGGYDTNFWSHFILSIMHLGLVDNDGVVEMESQIPDDLYASCYGSTDFDVTHSGSKDESNPMEYAIAKLLAMAGDRIAPAAVTDLAAGSPTTTTATLTWTAPGDDGNEGTARVRCPVFDESRG